MSRALIPACGVYVKRPGLPVVAVSCHGRYFLLGGGVHAGGLKFPGQKGLRMAACAGQRCLSTPTPTENFFAMAVRCQQRRSFDAAGIRWSCRPRAPLSEHVVCRPIGLIIGALGAPWLIERSSYWMKARDLKMSLAVHSVVSCKLFRMSNSIRR